MLSEYFGGGRGQVTSCSAQRLILALQSGTTGDGAQGSICGPMLATCKASALLHPGGSSTASPVAFEYLAALMSQEEMNCDSLSRSREQDSSSEANRALETKEKTAPGLLGPP